MSEVSDELLSAQNEQDAAAPVPASVLDRRAALWVRILWSPTSWSFSILLILCIIFSALRPDAFPTLFNVRSIAITASSFIVMGIGVTFVLSAGGLDLSVGAVLVLGGIMGTKAMVAVGGSGWPTIGVGLLASLATGLLVGLANGLFIRKFRIPPLVVTLGTSFIVTGLGYVVTGGQDLRGVPDLMVSVIGLGSLLGIPYVVWVAAVTGLGGILVYEKTRFGRYTQAIGSSEEAAVRSGIRVDRHLIMVYTYTGALAGLAGFLNLALFGTTTISGHTADFLYVVLAVILGGTSLFGGVGTVAGTCLAAFIPWVLNDGFIILGVDPYWQYVTLGAIFIVVVYLDALRRRAREKVRA